jgi:hypothetical protein
MTTSLIERESGADILDLGGGVDALGLGGGVDDLPGWRVII